MTAPIHVIALLHSVRGPLSSDKPMEEICQVLRLYCSSCFCISFSPLAFFAWGGTELPVSCSGRTRMNATQEILPKQDIKISSCPGTIERRNTCRA